MSTFVILAIVLAVGQASLEADFRLRGDLGKQSRTFGRIILEKVECIRRQLEDGNPEYDIPSLKRLEVDSLEVDFDQFDVSTLSGSLNLSNVEVDGLTVWNVEASGRIGLFPPSYSVTLKIQLPKIRFSADYELDAEYQGESLTGEGTWKFEASLSVDSYFKVKLRPSGMVVDDLLVRYRLEPLKYVEITGLFGNEELSAQVSSELAAKAHILFNEHANVLEELAEKSLGEASDKIAELVKQCPS